MRPGVAQDWDADEGGGIPFHYLTFSDMMTLLFCFFVVLYALFPLSASQREQLSRSIRESLPAIRVGGAGAPARPGGGGPAALPSAPGASPLGPAPAGLGKAPGDGDKILDSVRTNLAAQGFGDGVEVVAERQGILIRVRDNLLFASGSAEVHPEGRRLVAAIAKAVADLPGGIRVEGHTDDVPIHNARFPSNWELSAARAVTVVRLLTEVYGISPDRVMFAGYGEYKPLVPNTSAANRQRNRRVEVYLQTGM